MPMRIPYIYTPRPHHCRRYSFLAAPPHPPPTGISNISGPRQLIEIHGRDAAKYLQGLTTRKTPVLSDARGAYSAFLNAQGKVLYDVFIYPTNHNARWRTQVETKNFQPLSQSLIKKGPTVDDPGFFIECDVRSADALLDHIRRYKVSSKFHSRIIPRGEWDMWTIWDDHRLLVPGLGEIGCTDTRAPNLGRRVAVFGGGKLGVEVDFGIYNVRRMLHGVPEGQDEIPSGGNIAQENSMDYMGGVDFRKGCYVGQELTIRTHHTGAVRKRVLPIQLYRAGDPAPERLTYDPNLNLAPLLHLKDPAIRNLHGKGRPAGKFLRGLGNIGLALCRLEVMTDLEVGKKREDKTVPEFKLGDEEDKLRVKAFVPGWHLSGNATTSRRAPVTASDID